MLEHIGGEKERGRERAPLTHSQGQNGRNFRISCVWHFVSSSPLPISPVPSGGTDLTDRLRSGCIHLDAMISHFIAAAIIPAYENIAEDFSISITKASYLTSLQIAIVGFAPLFWKPISNRYGRRPVWLISTLGSALLNVGCAFSDSYSTMAVCRAFVAFFISPPVGIGSGVVTETYFKKQRGQFMGLWTLLLTLGQWRFIEKILSCVDDIYVC